MSKWLAVFLMALSTMALAKELKVPGSTMLEARTLSGTVVVEIQTRQRERLTSTELDLFLNSPSVHFGLSDRDENVIRRIKITWGKLPPIFLPLSVSNDLHDPRQANVDVKGENVLLLINGGSTAGAYSAQFEIGAHGLLRRSVKNLKLGIEQVTTMSYPDSYVQNTREELQRLQTQNSPIKKSSGPK